jgi:hypothetical protein
MIHNANVIKFSYKKTKYAAACNYFPLKHPYLPMRFNPLFAIANARHEARSNRVLRARQRRHCEGKA